MLETVRKHAQGWLAKIILAGITIPFALWGVDSYFKGDGRGNVVAQAGNVKIYEQEVSQGVRDEMARLRSQMGPSFDDAMIDPNEVRQRVVSGLIEEHLVRQAVQQARVALTPDQLRAEIAAVPAFQENGQFSKARYEAALQARGMRSADFEKQVRDQLSARQLLSGYAQGAIISRATVNTVLRANEQQREVSLYSLPVDQYMAKATVSDAEVHAAYDKNRARFAVPEQVQLQYIVLSPQTLASQVQVSDDELKNYYQKNTAQFADPEQRTAAHILLTVDPNAPAAQQEEVLKRAKALAEEVRKNPASFADVARKNSQDPGSADKGGELGTFPRGAMVKPFEDAVFGMKEGEISEPVKSEFGYHIIKLEKIIPAQTKPFEQVKDQVRQKVVEQKALALFNQIADQFSNLAFEQSDSLKPAADAVKLPIQESALIGRTNQDPLLSSRKLMDAVFADDVLKNGRNTDAIEVAPNTLVAARVIKHVAAGVRPFDEVKDALTMQLRAAAAMKLAQQDGQALLTRLNKGEQVDLKWEDPVTATRQQGPWAVPLKEQIFRAGVAKLPVYVGVADGRSFQLARITKVVDVSEIPAEKQKMYQDGLAELLGNEAVSLYLEGLKKSAKIEMKTPAGKAADSKE